LTEVRELQTAPKQKMVKECPEKRDEFLGSFGSKNLYSVPKK